MDIIAGGRIVEILSDISGAPSQPETHTHAGTRPPASAANNLDFAEIICFVRFNPHHGDSRVGLSRSCMKDRWDGVEASIRNETQCRKFCGCGSGGFLQIPPLQGQHGVFLQL